MAWLHHLQQRLSITKNEALTLLSLSLFLLLGTAGRYACRQMRPISADYYSETDSLFAERSSAKHGDAAARPDTAHSAARFDSLITATSSGALTTAASSGALTMATSSGALASATPFDPKTSAVPSGSEAKAGVVGANAERQRRESEDPRNSPRKSAAPQLLHVDLNRATRQELEQLPRIGPRTAERIIAFREAYGSFRSVDELLSVSGIGPKTLEKLRPHVHVQPDSAR